jgi:hypothetical protein
MIQDLIEYITGQQESGASILLGIDANETTKTTKSGIRQLVEKCGLVDIHAKLFPNESWASHRRGKAPIDFFCINRHNELYRSGWDNKFRRDILL